MTDAAQAERLPIRTILTVSLGLVLPALPAFLIGALGSQLRSEFDLTESGLGFVVATLFVAAALAGPFTGRLADRFGAQVVIAAGTAVSFLSLAGIALAAHQWHDLLVLMAIAGLGAALVDPGLARLVAARVPARRRGLAFGLKEASIPLATMASGFAVPTIAVTMGWRWACAVSLVPFTAMVVLLATGGAGRRGHALRSDAGPAPAAAGVRTPLATLPRAVLYMAVGGALGSLAATGISVFLTESAVAAGLTASHGGVLLGIASMAGVATRILSGILADRRPATAVHLIPVMLGFGALTMLLGAAGTSLALGAGAIGAIVGGWGWSALFFLALIRSEPTRPGAVAGVGLSGLAVGNALGPIAFGAVAQSASFRTAWLFAAGVAAIAAGVMYRAGRLLDQPPVTGSDHSPGGGQL